ncbi:MAG: M56 family metallopeptidase [Aurantibacter sp.]
MLIYILKSAACLAILFLFYKLFLEKENMHVFKRFYLLGALLFSLIIPTIVFSEYVVVEPQVYEAPTQSVMVESSHNIPPALESDVMDIAPLLWIVYFLGMFFFGIKFLKNLFQIFKRIHRNPKYKNASFIQVLLQEKIPPHTFFKYIFLNKSKFESKLIPREVLLHEETHAIQKHSLDVIFIELLQVIFWINPLIYFFKKAIKLNHEFLADRAVLNKDVDAITYQNTLLSFLSSESAKRYQLTLPNAINYSSIKKRFTIMKSKTSKKAIVFRSFLLLPLLALLLAGFTQTKLVKVPLEKEAIVAGKFSPPTFQEGATEEQVAEYDALAGKYNTLIDKEENVWIKKGDVERLEYLHGIMTEEQRANAEPFPDFPEPPEPPEAPVEIEEEVLELEREMERQAEAMEEQRIEMEKEAEAMEEQRIEMERQAKVMEEQEVEMNREMEHQTHVREEQQIVMEKQAETTEEQQVEMERQVEIMEEQQAEIEEQVREMKEREMILPPPPPAPSEPKSPMEFVKEMKEKNAEFYYNGKKISAAKAIEILESSEHISLEARHTNLKRPKVELSDGPIKVVED